MGVSRAGSSARSWLVPAGAAVFSAQNTVCKEQRQQHGFIRRGQPGSKGTESRCAGPVSWGNNSRSPSVLVFCTQGWAMEGAV